jgi:hypothetical protein
MVTQRQFNLVQWWAAMSNNVQTIDTVTILQYTLTTSGVDCATWSAIALAGFQGAGGTGTYDSYFWIFPQTGVVAGCGTPDPDTFDVTAELGPCGVGGCMNVMWGAPYINSYIYAMGRNQGLRRSNTVATANGDLTCQMGRVSTTPGSQRYGFNALKLQTLGFISALTVTTTAIYLSGTYTQIAGAVRLINLSGTSYYLAYRGPLEWGIDRNNNWGSGAMNIGTVALNGVTFVYRLEMDGSSTAIATFGDGTNYTVSGFIIRQDWHDNNGTALSITNTPMLPTPLVKPAAAFPCSGSVWGYTGLISCGQQYSPPNTPQQFITGALVLHICFLGDDRNASSFIPFPIDVPVGASILSATMYLEADHDQLQAVEGTTSIAIHAEQTTNSAIPFSGNMFLRSYFAPSSASLTGDWYTGDDIAVDVTTQVQNVIALPGWGTNGVMAIIIYSNSTNQQFTRTIQSGSACTAIGGYYNCGPRLFIVYA